MKPGELIEESRQLYEAATGRSARVSTSLEEVVGCLLGGGTRIPLEVPWDEERGSERVQRHQVVLLQVDLEAGRLHFFNPAATEVPPGTDLGGVGQGPSRRAERPGRESMELALLADFFARGEAFALLR